MVRAFEDRPVPSGLVDRILANALRAPSAGFTQGVHFVVLEGRSQTELFWRYTAEESWRREPNWPALPTAPVVIVPLAHRQAYLARYAEPDKWPGPSGATVEAGWVVPYWLVDAAFATMVMLLTATDEGLGALFFRVHHGEAELLHALQVPDGYQPIGAVALGWPAPDRPSPSLARGRRPPDEVIHRGGW
jgi:nitroreductase